VAVHAHRAAPAAGSAATGEALSLRKIAAANAARALLMFVGVLLALSAAGIPLGALGVLGGAIGVGIGFGLQKLAANYVSGFVILAERSLRIGDVVKVEGFEGRITDIHTRYTVIRALNGRESIVPNELLITQRVENASLADTRLMLQTTVQAAYGTDVDALFPALVQAVSQVPRVVAEPAPSVQLSAFAADGLELTIPFWIADPEDTGRATCAARSTSPSCARLPNAGCRYPTRSAWCAKPEARRRPRGRAPQAVATGILPMRACHSFGPVWCTLVPEASTATVTGMSRTSNS
jgi:small-conductance mechanosensitive channel